MKKKLLSTLLALCMVLALLPGGSQAAERPTSGKYGDLTWTYDEANGTLTISGKGEMPDADTSAEMPWNNYSKYISKVVIEKGVTSIGKYAFSHLSELSNLIIPDSVTAIGEWAFAWCSSLASITIPGTVNTISSGLLNGCSNLSEVAIQNGVKYIESGAFSGCTKLAHISIPASVIRIGSSYNASYDVFTGCSNLTEITVDSQNTEYTSQNGALFTKEKDTLLFCPQGKTVFTIPNGVSSIELSALRNCAKLTTVTIPDSINNIEFEAFFGCVSLTDVTIPEGVAFLSRTFFGCSSLKTIHLPASLTYIGSDVFYSCPSLPST